MRLQTPASPALPPFHARARAATSCLPSRPQGHGARSGATRLAGVLMSSLAAGRVRRAAAGRREAGAGVSRSPRPPPAAGASPMGVAVAGAAR